MANRKAVSKRKPKPKKRSTTGKSAAERRAKVKNPLIRELMERTETYLKPDGRNIDATRLKKLEKVTGKSKAALRGAFLYGEGSAETWADLQGEVTPVSNEELIKLWETWPIIQKKIKSTPPELQKLYRTIRMLSKDDQLKVGLLLDTFISASKLKSRKTRKK